MFTRGIAACAWVALVMAVASAEADVVTDWNSIWLDCIRATGGPPCPIARAGGMVHAAVYDAVNSIDRTHEPYLVSIDAPAECPQEAAAAVAAHDVLVHLYPERRSILDAKLASSLSEVPDGRLKRVAMRIGRVVARRVIAARRGDGSEDDTPYVPEMGPGDWRPTPPDYSAPATPNWGRVRPWAMVSGDQFRPIGPLRITDMHSLLTSPGYTKMFMEVKDLGARNSPSRTPYETETAFFWANDVDGTYKPPGHLNHIAQVLAEQESLTLPERARLFALLNIALADAGIVAWDCKYDVSIDFWRPIAGIREADTDDNPLTGADPSWEPLNAFTPPFPAYISGHATFAATAAAILAAYFGTDEITHTIGTDDPLYTGSPRTYDRFSVPAIENARSRIYLGVHWQFDADDGLVAGTALGKYVYAKIMRPLDANRPFLASGDAAAHDAGAELVSGPQPLNIIFEPALSRTLIEYALPAAGPVRVSVHDVLGRHVATLVDAHQEAGKQGVSWSNRSGSGSPVRSGVYFVRVAAPGMNQTRKVVVLP